MDAKRFDTIVCSLTAAGTRRGALGFLATLPLLGGFFGLFDPAETDAKSRRKKKRRKKKCKSQAKVCAGKCGRVRYKCKKRKKTADCGVCGCAPACDACSICDETTRSCAPDPDKEGEPCGAPGQLCQFSGACVCDDFSCRNPTPLCLGDFCEACLDDEECQGFGLGDVCCGGSCISGDCCDVITCSSDEAPDCLDGACVCFTNGDVPCGSGQACCGDGCVDLATDPFNCGACGNFCGIDGICVGGVCQD